MAKQEDLRTTHEWLDAVSAELGISPELTRAAVGDILKLTADVAHNGPSRPAAPTTAFVVGLAAGRLTSAADPAEHTHSEVRRIVTQVLDLLQGYGAHDATAKEEAHADGAHAKQD